MAILLATILVIGRLSSDYEILALRSAGVGLLRILDANPIGWFGERILNISFNENCCSKGQLFRCVDGSS